MSIAVIKTGGKQYLVEKGSKIKVEKIDKKDQEIIEFTDLLNGKKVKAEIVCLTKGKKIRVFKYKRKTGYRKTQGHRQAITTLEVKDIV